MCCCSRINNGGPTHGKQKPGCRSASEVEKGQSCAVVLTAIRKKDQSESEKSTPARQMTDPGGSCNSALSTPYYEYLERGNREMMGKVPQKARGLVIGLDVHKCR